MLLGFAEYAAPARRLAQRLGRSFALIDIHRFPDGESRLALPRELPADVLFCRSLDRPNDKLIELLLAARTAREMGVTRLGLVAPYLCYMRQDIAFHPGEAVSQHIIGEFLADLFDSVVTVDPHLHRVHRLQQAVPVSRATALSVAPSLGGFLQRHIDRPVLIGPDDESEQWVAAAAGPAGLDYGVANKQRLDDNTVRVNLPGLDIRGRQVVLVDDIISTGHTMAEAARQLSRQGAAAVHAFCTHALFAEGAEALLREAGVGHIWSSDSIPHPSNALELAPLLASVL